MWLILCKSLISKKLPFRKRWILLLNAGRFHLRSMVNRRYILLIKTSSISLTMKSLLLMKEENAKLQEQLEQQKKAITEVEGEIRSLQSNLTLEEIHDKEARLRRELRSMAQFPKLEAFHFSFVKTGCRHVLPNELGKFFMLFIMYQVKEMEDKLVQLRGGVTLVRPEEKRAVEAIYSEKMSQWRTHKRMFKDLRDAITENSPKDLKEFKEELGIEYDEDAGVDLQSLSELLQHGKKRARG